MLLQFLVILSGATEGNPENQIYFLQSTTNGIPGARNPSRWTFFSICGVDANDRNTNCGAVVPALPFDPPNRHDFNTTIGVPSAFIGTKHYFLLSRFAFVFYLIAVVFAAIALLTSVLALCTRLGAYFSGFNTAVALFFQGIAAALTTAWVVQGRDVFRAAGQSASVGEKAMAFVWTAFACFFISTLMFCAGGSARHDRGYTASRRTGMFGRKRSTRSRASFVSDRNGGIKNDYA